MIRSIAAWAGLALCTVTLTQCGGGASATAELPPGIDLSNAQVVEVRDTGGQVVLTGTFADHHKASLASADPNAKAKGEAEYEVEKDGNAIKQELETSVEGLPGSTQFTIVVDGRQVGSFITTDGGKRELKVTRKDAA